MLPESTHELSRVCSYQTRFLQELKVDDLNIFSTIKFILSFLQQTLTKEHFCTRSWKGHRAKGRLCLQNASKGKWDSVGMTKAHEYECGIELSKKVGKAGICQQQGRALSDEPGEVQRAILKGCDQWEVCHLHGSDSFKRTGRRSHRHSHA